MIYTYRICVYGIVQGVGFRPFVSRIADASGVKGSVANRGSYVEIFAKGDEERIDEFMRHLEADAPERSSILKVTKKEIPADDERIAPFDTFEIIESEKEEGSIFVSPDIATCDKCKKELYDPTNMRYMHPFINCTACGPRLTILDSMPYDRVRTSMGEFPLCPECDYEYTHAETRRYDAQPVCCNKCGPEVYIITPSGNVGVSAKAENTAETENSAGTKDPAIEAADKNEKGSYNRYGVRAAIRKPVLDAPVSGREAIIAARQGIIDGKIIAIKGIGGFHLCCDAKNEEAVARLRKMKRRPMKPFAVMMKDLETAKRECIVPNDEVREMLDGHQKPIILLRKNGENCSLAPSVAPDNPKIGVMLPYAPVQMLLFDYNDGLDLKTDCLVMTSGNVSGAPICRTDEDAVKELSSFCDIILSNNRKIRLRADDTVMDMYRGEPYMIRRSRGFAPLPIMTEAGIKHTVLGIGGELKNTFCIAKNELYYESPYVGDMADIRTVKALEESVKRMEELLEAEPEVVVCDLHPKYNTTFVAGNMGLEVLPVQHHFAHVLSCMAENDFQGRVLGISFDGTGYGTDGTIWGGEILASDHSGFERVGSIVPFAQAGGDASSKEGWRIAASMIHGLYGNKTEGTEAGSVSDNDKDKDINITAEDICRRIELCSEAEYKLVGKMVEKKINTVTSTSAGRLFDAVSAVLGIRKSSTFEGEASTTLQFKAEEYIEKNSNDKFGDISKAVSAMNDELEAIIDKNPKLIEIKKFEGRLLLPTDELFKYILEERLAGQAADRLAYLFHGILGKQIVETARRLCKDLGLETIALSGGVFQNTLLLEQVESGLETEFKVLRHHLIPPNDGGLALGQAAYGMYYLKKRENT